MMDKYQEALKWFQSIYETLGQEEYYEDLGMRFGQGLCESIQTIKELVDKATPVKPKIVKLFGNYVPTCPAKNCGIGLVEEETTWHKSTYCGRCGQAIDWSEECE